MTAQRGGMMAKSTIAVPGIRCEGAVRSVKIEGSGWSWVTEPRTTNLAMSYL